MTDHSPAAFSRPSRRDFLRRSLYLASGLGTLALGRRSAAGEGDDLFRISLAEWSYHRDLFSGKLDHLEFAPTARRVFGIAGVEYVNQFFFDRAEDQDYLREMKRRADGEGVSSLLIMCDGEGRLGAPDRSERLQAVENHTKWIAAASYLGCHSIRVNADSEGSFDEQLKLAADGLRELTEIAGEHGLDTLVENHGGLSSNGHWLSGLMKAVDHPRCGTLPDFGNFGSYGGHDFNAGAEAYDRYVGVAELMPWAKALSAKSYSFDSEGNEATIDYRRMLKIALDSGYGGWVGIEYEGEAQPEVDGIRATMKLLETLRVELASAAV